MTLDEAIAHSEELNPLFETWLHEDFEKAHKLGIEALKRLAENRHDNPDTAWLLLPGETKE